MLVFSARGQNHTLTNVSHLLKKDNAKLRATLTRKQKQIDKNNYKDDYVEDEEYEDEEDEEVYDENNVDWTVIENVKNTIGLGHVNFNDPAMRQTAIQVLNSKPDIAKAYEQAKQMGASAVGGGALTSSGLPASQVDPHAL